MALSSLATLERVLEMDHLCFLVNMSIHQMCGGTLSMIFVCRRNKVRLLSTVQLTSRFENFMCVLPKEFCT